MSEAADSSPLNPATAAMGLAWTFGLNTGIVGGIHALTDNMIFYASAHTGVIYDDAAGTQQSMLGHCNQISALTTSHDKQYLVTADKGADPLLIVWSTNCDKNAPGKPLPIRTIFDPHGGCGVTAVAFTFDAQYLVTLGDDSPQTIAVWDWTTEEDNPVATAVVEGEKQTSLMVNPADPFEILSTSAHAISFYTWTPDSGIQQYSPSLNPKDFKHVPTSYTQSTFLPATPQNTIGQALTATADGDIVVWTDRSLFNLSETLEKGRKAGVKIMKLHTGGINVLSVVGDKYLVTGGEDGFVRVCDLQFRLIVWFERLRSGPIISITTTLTHTLQPPAKSDTALETPATELATLETDPEDLPDLLIATRHSKVFRLTKPGDGIVGAVGNPLISVLMEGSYGQMHGLAIHPKETHFAIGGSSGWLHVYDFTTKKPIHSRRLEEPWEETRDGTKQKPADLLSIQCLSYNPNGSCLAIGFTNGTLRILNPTTLQDLPQRSPASHRAGIPGYAVAKGSILRVVFDPRGRWMAVTDALSGIGVFEWKAGEWGFVGRCRAHYLEIVGLLFVPPPPDGSVSRLISVSADRHIVEYDLTISTITTGIAVKSKARIDQINRPVSATMHPSPPLRGPHDAPQHYLLTATTASKFKIYNAETGMCRRTVVAPAYGGDIRFLEFIPAHSKDASSETTAPRFLAYATKSKVVGLLALPLDGNPHNSMGMYAHPGDIAALHATPCGTMLLTLGQQDGVVNLWKINPDTIVSPAQTGAAVGIAPWLDLLHTGEDRPARDAFVREMEDYFYYAQLRSQGEETTTSRLITTTVSLDQVPLIMQAMGYYPSQAETDDMLNEVRYAGWFKGADATLRNEVDFEELVKLYVNHRPLEDYTQNDIFQALGYAKRMEPGVTADGADMDMGNSEAKNEDIIGKEGLIALLQQYGETLSAANFTDAMQSLLLNDPMYRGVFPERVSRGEFVENMFQRVIQKALKL
ncbi:hypothetical protein PhCBS80983_g04702 [Powellomyces hirtus]|uniref:Cilia- and flagella-associated protein 251 n=1 Tax=Powellomyces hirtus TaxID=109895 RepID=A0A507DYF4_9FUNG|nr:hypothetical protein PhCBS80983_g04702 [Powellomyces hirtus]